MNRIAAIRSKRGLTQGELAKEIGVSRTTICNWESGNVCLDAMKKLAQYFDVSLVDLYGYDVFLVKPQNDCEVQKMLNMLTWYVTDEKLIRKIREAAIC